ncbi:nucleotidyltransferase family protein, partial [Helicobacter heilmannii]
EGGFKELLEGLTQPSSTLQADNLLKSVGSIESKLERKQGRVESLNDLLRGAIVAKNRDVINDQLAQIAIHFRDSNIPHRIEYKEYRASGYEGVHIHFKHNDVPAEIQVHTPKSWENKKAQDGNYHIMREQQVNPTLTKEEWERLSAESRALGQDSDLDINLFTSFEVISTESGSAASLNLLKSEKDLNLTHILRLKSNSKATSSDADMAYKRPDSELNQKEEIATGGKGIDSDIQTPLNDSTTPPLNITPNPEFGENFKEFEGKGAEAVKKLLQEKRGQVAGAFYREDLGYIDLV